MAQENSPGKGKRQGRTKKPEKPYVEQIDELLLVHNKNDPKEGLGVVSKADEKGNYQTVTPEEKNETSLLQWMRFLGGKTRKDFEEMAKKNSELEEAYDVLDKLSADEKKRLEYETRQRAIRDYNIGMLTAERRGIEAGRKIGRQEGREEGETLGVSRINQLILELSKLGRTDDIVKAAADEEYQKKLLEEFDL